MNRSPFQRLRCDNRGASAIEFALLAPLFFALLFGVVAVGIYFQNYNAIRSLASDASRFTTVEYEKNNKISATTIEDNVESMGISSPYFLNANNLSVSVEQVNPSRVSGASEFNMNITYQLPAIVGGIAIDNVAISYSRPIFVLNT
jgi:Flp pilus assembly protein TadG